MSETELKILSSVSTRMTFANVVLGIGLVHSTVERLYIYIYIYIGRVVEERRVMATPLMGL